MTWSAKIVEVDASKTVVRTLVNCSVRDVPIDPLNPTGREFATITIPKYEVGSAVGQYADIRLGRHIQIFEDATLRFEGIAMKRSSKTSEGAVEIPVYDQGWYLAKSNITAPVRDLLTNGNAEAGTTGWTAVGCTMTADTSRVRRGSTAFKLVGSSTFAESYIYQQVVVTGTGVGTALTVRAWFNIDTWTGPAIYARGLFVQSIASGVVETFNDRDGVIDDDTALALDNWQRVEITTWVPPNATRTIEVRFYVGNATIYVDEIGLFEPTSLAIAPGAGENIATTANRIIQFIQDTTKGKSDKRIGTTTAPTTGKLFYFPKSYQYADKTPADTALEEIVNLGVDYSLALTTTATTATWHYPQKGSDLTGSITLSTSNVASWSYDEDNDPVETDSTILGEGDGPDREEGHAADAYDAGGLVLEGVESVPAGTTIDKLDELAAARLALRKRPVKVLTVTTKGAVAVTTGDTVASSLVDGVIDTSTNYWRVVQGKRLPRTNGCLELVLNDVPGTLAFSGDDATPTSPTALDGGTSSGSASVVDGGLAA